MITWLSAKSLLGSLVSFLTRYPLQITLVVVCLYAYHEKTAHDAAVQALATFKTDIANAGTKQAADMAIKHVTAQSSIDVVANQEKFDMARLSLDREQSTNEIKKLYETQINSLKRNLANRNNGVLPPISDTGTASEISSGTQEFTASGQECNAAIARAKADYSTLEDACTITTSDFNVCRTVIDADTLMYGRTE